MRKMSKFEGKRIKFKVKKSKVWQKSKFEYEKRQNLSQRVKKWDKNKKIQA